MQCRLTSVRCWASIAQVHEQLGDEKRSRPRSGVSFALDEPAFAPKAAATDERAVMKTQKQGEPVVRPPDTQTDWSRKTERALEIRESTAKARADKPIAFPTRRVRS